MVNDNQVDRLTVARAGVEPPGHVEVRIAVIGEIPLTATEAERCRRAGLCEEGIRDLRG